MSSTTRHFYEFGPYRVDPALCRLLRGETQVSLPPKAFDLLLILVRNPNRVLSKGELIQALWPDTFVDEGNLTQHVFTLRNALGTQPGGAAYIETVPRRGYIFAAAVREGTDSVSRVESPPTTPAVLEGERKQATVLRCGVANAGALAERLGPAQLDSLMTELASVAAEETGRYEGVLQRTRPGAVEAVFGARVVHEDDPWRAVLTALALQHRFARLDPERRPDDDRPALRIGIATGLIVVTRRVDDRGADYSVVGEPVRVADLLQQLAEPGTTLISHATRQAVEGHVALERTTIDFGGGDAGIHDSRGSVRILRQPRAVLAAGRPRTRVLRGQGRRQCRRRDPRRTRGHYRGCRAG